MEKMNGKPSNVHTHTHSHARRGTIVHRNDFAQNISLALCVHAAG